MENRNIGDIIKRNIDKGKIVNLVKALVDFESAAPPGNEYEIGMYLAECLQSLGMEVELQKAAEKRFNVIGRLKGSGKKPATLIYNGHIDVVPAGDEKLWTNPPYRCTQVGDRLYGRGTSDMKGSIGAALCAIEVLRRSQVRLEGDLLVALVVDEEVSNLGMKKLLAEGIKADYCLVGEPTNLEIAIGHRGVMAFKISVAGKSVHAAQAGQGINAIYHAAKIIDGVKRLNQEIGKRTHPLFGAATVTATTINGGIKVNVVPDHCEVMVDRRLVPGETKEQCIQEIEIMLEQLKRDDEEMNCTYEVTTFCPPGGISESEAIVSLLKKEITGTLGQKPVIKGFEATCEASLVMEGARIPTVIFGPGSIRQAHNIDEYIEIDQLVKATEIFANLYVDMLG